MPLHDKTDDALNEFLGDRARADQLRVWREALQSRLDRLRAEAKANPDVRDVLKPKIENMERQVAALRDEEAITGFVEDSVRAVVADMGQTHAPPDGPSECPPWASQDEDDKPET